MVLVGTAKVRLGVVWHGKEIMFIGDWLGLARCERVWFGEVMFMWLGVDRSFGVWLRVVR